MKPTLSGLVWMGGGRSGWAAMRDTFARYHRKIVYIGGNLASLRACPRMT